GLERQTTITGYLESEAELTAHLAACDVSINLRWPTAREMSGPWLRALAAGRRSPPISRTWLTCHRSIRGRGGCGMRGAGSGMRDPMVRDSGVRKRSRDTVRRIPDPGS